MCQLFETLLKSDSNEIKNIDKIIELEGINNYTKTIEIGSNPGDNYFGTIFRIIINGINSENKATTLHLILKCSTRDRGFRLAFPHNAMYKREIFMYRSYIPELVKLQNKYQIKNGLENIPKLYAESSEDLSEFLIMSDQKQMNFKMYDRQKSVDLNHCYLVLKQLAFLHGTGFVLKENDPQLYKQLTSDKNSVFDAVRDLPHAHKQWISITRRALDTIDPVIYPKLYERFANFLNSYKCNVQRLKEYEKMDQYFIMVHADCWTNNFLFKYQRTQDDFSSATTRIDNSNATKKQPKEICLLDWQQAHYSSPVKDLSYFIYNCTSTEFRDKHFNHLIDYYYQNLSNVIKQCDQSCEKLYPFEIFQEHLKVYFSYGFSMALLTIPLFISDSDEIREKSATTNNRTKQDKNELDLDRFNIQSRHTDVYKERILGIVQHVVENDFI